LGPFGLKLEVRNVRRARSNTGAMLLAQLVLGPLALGLVAGLRLETLGAWTAAGAGSAVFAAAQMLAAAWLLMLDRAR